MKIRTLLLMLVVATGARAQQPYTPQGLDAPIKEAAFKGGEKLTYALSYSLKFFGTDVAEVVFRTNNTVINNIPTYRIYANAKTLPSYRIVYDLDDTYETWLDISTLRPVKFSSRLKEAKYRYRADYLYNWGNMEVHTTYRNMKRPNANTKTMPLTDQSADALAFFYNLRSEDIASFKEGEVREFDFVMDNKIRRISYKYLGKETKSFKKLGTFKTLKLSCQLTSGDDLEGQTFQEGSEFFLWITDDRNHIPIYIESPIKVGSIVATLNKYEELKYPLESKIK